MKLSIIIPVYNGATHILRCLESLREQSFRDFQTLLIDDGSTDNSAEIIQKYLAETKELNGHLIRHMNKGVSETRNTGIELADTEYITFIDQDDYVATDYLENYIRAIEESDADIVCGGYKRLDVEKRKCIRTVSLSKDPWSKFIVVAPWAHLYKSDFLKKHQIRFLKTGIGEDVYFSLLAYAYTNNIVTISDTGYYWVDNPSSHSNSNQRRIQKSIDPFILLNALTDDLPTPNQIEEYYLEYFIYRYIVWYLLFTIRQTPKNILMTQYDKLIQWLKKHYPDFYKNPLISLFALSAEPFIIRLTVWGFTLLYRFHILKPILKLLASR